MSEETKELEGISGIFIAEHKINNMDMERIVVSNPAIQQILNITKISQEVQEKAVNDLVDRTPDWLDLETEDQIAKIKVVLTQETVVAYLQEKEVIRNKVDTLEVGIDEEGSIVVYAYYVNLNREQRRLMAKTIPAKQKEQMAQAVNILGSSDNLIDLAAKKMERLKQVGKKTK